MSTNTITRDQLVAKLRGVQGKIKALENKAPYSYKTMHKYLPNIGKIQDLDTPVELVRAHAYVMSETSTLETSAKELGVELKKSQLTLLGFAKSTWVEEIKARLNEITREDQLAQLRTVESTLIDNMTDEDRFELEVGGASKLSVLDDIDEYVDFEEDEDEE
jgi:hypothetical protein